MLGGSAAGGKMVMEKYFTGGKNILEVGEIFYRWKKYFTSGKNILQVGKI